MTSLARYILVAAASLFVSFAHAGAADIDVAGAANFAEPAKEIAAALGEPLAAPGRATKNEILPCLERLCAGRSLPVIDISHDMAEIERLADHLVLVDQDKVAAAGPLHQLQSDPALPLGASGEAAVSLDALVGGFDGRYGLPILRVNVRPARIRVPPPLGDGEVRLVLALGSEGCGTRILARIAPVMGQARPVGGHGRLCPDQGRVAGVDRCANGRRRHASRNRRSKRAGGDCGRFARAQ